MPHRHRAPGWLPEPCTCQPQAPYDIALMVLKPSGPSFLVKYHQERPLAQSTTKEDGDTLLSKNGPKVWNLGENLRESAPDIELTLITWI